MTKNDLIKKVADQNRLSLSKTGVIVNAVFDTIRDELLASGSVGIIGFGTFSVKHRAAREGRDPRTGETIDLPETKYVHFKAGKTLKGAVNQC